MCHRVAVTPINLAAEATNREDENEKGNYYRATVHLMFDGSS